MLRELRARAGLLLMRAAVRLLGPETVREAVGEPDWSSGWGTPRPPEEQQRLEAAARDMGIAAGKTVDRIAREALGAPVETRVSTPAYSPTVETARVLERYAPRRRATEPADDPPLRGSLESRRAERE